MIRKGMLWGVVGVLAMALSLAAARPAQAQNSCTSLAFDVTGDTLTNPCNGENVMITSGTETFTFCLNDNKTASIRLDTHAMGVGDQDNAYVIYSHQNAPQAANAQGLFEGNMSFQENVISQGSAPNFIENCTSHFTLTPSGQLNVQPYECDAICVGSQTSVLNLKSGTTTDRGMITAVGPLSSSPTNSFGMGPDNNGPVALPVQIDKGPATLVLLTPAAP